MIKENKSYLYKAVIFIHLVIITLMLDSSLGINLPILKYIFASLGLYFIIKEYINNKIENATPFIFQLFILWNLIIVLRGVGDLFNSSQNYISFKRFLGEEILVYSFPLLIFTNIKISELRKVIILLLFFGVAYLLITIPYFNYFTSVNTDSGEFSYVGESYIVYFPSSLIFLLFTTSYYSKRINFLNIFIILLALIISLILARRNKVLYFGGSILLAMYLLNFSSSQIIKKNRTLNIILTITFILLASVFAIINSKRFDYFFERTETGIESREGVIDDFFYDFNNNPTDWLIGRGMHGTFNTKILSLSELDDSRNIIENGFLYAILKGGILYLIFLGLIIIISVYNGLYKSKNLTSKAMACLLILYLIDMIGFGLPSIGFKYLVVWIAIAICNSKKITSLSDTEIKNIIFIK